MGFTKIVMSKSSTHISLAGGLGNQLFQLAAGLYVAQGGALYLNTAFGNLRTNSDGEAELLSFLLPDNVIVEKNRSAPWFLRKIAGFFLKRDIYSRTYRLISLATQLIAVASSVPISLFLRRKISIKHGRDLSVLRNSLQSKNILLFGYFQTYRWVEDLGVKKILNDISIHSESRNLDVYKQLSKIERPMVVHVRLGDYLLEERFGTLSKEYYEKAIDRILKYGKCNTIWLFSDEIEKAKCLIPKNLDMPVRLIDNNNDSTSVVFEIMRLGYGYVIANSTFSWWAAYLSRNPNTPVIAPYPWFKGITEPLNLIPVSWLRLDGNVFT